MAKWIKNDTVGSKTYLNQVISAGTYYQIQSHEEIAWANNSALLTDIGSGDAIVSTTNAVGGHFTDVNEGINHLKDNLPSEVVQKFAVEEHVNRGNAFTSYTDFTTVSGTIEHDFLLIKNPSASGKDIMVTHFSWGVDANNVRSIVRIYFNPTITSDGTALGKINTLIKASPPTAEATTFKNPTISARGTKLNTQISPADTPSRGLNRTYYVEPGNELLVTIENSVSNASSFTEVYWLEI